MFFTSGVPLPPWTAMSRRLGRRLRRRLWRREVEWGHWLSRETQSSITGIGQKDAVSHGPSLRSSRSRLSLSLLSHGNTLLLSRLRTLSRCGSSNVFSTWKFALPRECQDIFNTFVLSVARPYVHASALLLFDIK